MKMEYDYPKFKRTLVLLTAFVKGLTPGAFVLVTYISPVILGGVPNNGQNKAQFCCPKTKRAEFAVLSFTGSAVTISKE